MRAPYPIIQRPSVVRSCWESGSSEEADKELTATREWGAGRSAITREQHMSNEKAWYVGITPYQWRVLVCAWLGWCLDIMDAYLYAIILPD
jgi:hypothetical protein